MDKEELDGIEAVKTIYNHFGREAQIEKLREEIEEFIEAIRSGDKAHAGEEAGDVLTVMAGFIFGEELNYDLVMGTPVFKMPRTLERMKSGYYDKGRQDDGIHEMDR